MPSWRREIARADTKPLSDLVNARRRVHHVASHAVSRVAASPATTASSTGSTMSVRSGSSWPEAESFETSTARASATRVSWATTAHRRDSRGRRTPESCEARVSRTTSPTAAQATPIAATSTSAAAAQLSHGSGNGSPGTSHCRVSTTLSPMPKADAQWDSHREDDERLRQPQQPEPGRGDAAQGGERELRHPDLAGRHQQSHQQRQGHQHQ